MIKDVKIISLVASGVILTLFVLFVITQTNQVVQLATGVNESFGQGVLYTLLLVYSLVVLIPIYLFVRMRAPLVPPRDDQSRAYKQFSKRLIKRLRSHQDFRNDVIVTTDDVKRTIAFLDKKANAVIEQTAKTVFATTAISQSGRLDAFIVLIAQSKMIWHVAHTYNQRPTLRDLFYLYSNVAATVFLVQNLEDIDVEEYIEPLIAGAAGTGLSLVSSFVAASLFDGAANAFMTLRIGVITRKYCGAITHEERRLLRRSATIEASKMLIPMMRSTGKDIYQKIKGVLKRRKSRDGEETSRTPSLLKRGASAIRGIFGTKPATET